MKYITILDFENGKTYIQQFNEKEQDAEDYLINEGFSPNNCQWMITKTINLLIN